MCGSGDRVFLQQLHHTALDQVDEVAHAQLQAAQIHQEIEHPLPRPVVGDLSAAIHLNDRYSAGSQYMLGPARLSLREHRRMLQQPQLVG